MSRWSDLMKLSEYEQFRNFIEHRSGCYQIGHARGSFFYPKYIGRAHNIWSRIKTYMNEERCHNPHIAARLYMERHTLWFRVLRTDRFKGLEARQLDTWGVRDEGIYEWNQRYEHANLGE